MEKVAMYLEGPGHEYRPVTLLSVPPEHSEPETAGLRSGITGIQIRRLVDEEGRIANQVDFDGFRFKYAGSNIPWFLVFG